MIYKSGAFLALLATLIWGMYPLFYAPLSNFSAIDVLVARIITSVCFLYVTITVGKSFSLSEVKTILQSKESRSTIVLSALITLVWWLVYIYAVTNELILEASLGYFISPIISVLFGILVFQERIRLFGKISISLMIIGVGYLVWQYGQVPYAAIMIGICFSLYAVVRKGKTIKPIEGLMGECLILLPVSILIVAYRVVDGTFSISSINFDIVTLALLSTGALSVLPLLWYGMAASKLSLISLSFFQFIPPICNLLFAVFIFHEDFTQHHIITFGFIWAALAAYLVEKFIPQQTKELIHVK
ncbi:EamA family transporter RarD [Aliivibrio fischeri]|uniref:EamA family transporter RarD n=1 Tax=Aliivibrio fischeri TaxID=668 RepID=UPI0037359218